eukprot:3213715-Prymnesium_polylepis.1
MSPVQPQLEHSPCLPQHCASPPVWRRPRRRRSAPDRRHAQRTVLAEVALAAAKLRLRGEQ